MVQAASAGVLLLFLQSYSKPSVFDNLRGGLLLAFEIFNNANDSSAVFYFVNNDNLIVGVDAEWDTAAAGHSDGQGPMSDKIIGRPLDDFLSGDATRIFVRAACAGATRLKGATRTLPYRCGSATHKLRFKMVSAL